MTMPSWYVSRQYAAALAQLEQATPAIGPIVQDGNGDYWCTRHDCSAYECACASHYSTDNSTCTCDACASIDAAERDIFAGLTPEQEFHVYNLVEQLGWDIDRALALYR